MPEGDTIYRTARTLQRALAGKRVVSFESALAKLDIAAQDAELVGQDVEEVSAHGKHVLMRFSSGVTLRSHMRMTGSWHIYRTGERWQRPHTEMRIALATADYCAVAFLVHEAELMGPKQLAQRVAALGPDVLAEEFDVPEVAARLRQQGERPVCDVLLDQRVLAGIGNVYKSELLFLARVHPRRPAHTLSEREARVLVERAAQLLRVNVQSAQDGIVTSHGMRRTTGRADPSDRLWVYNRAGRPCRECGELVVTERMGQHARSTYHCPRCQPLTPQARVFGA
jgi:endonuclease-8